MDDTIREKIIQEIVTRAAVIRTTGSPQLYATDCGAHVFRARPKVDPDDLDCIVIWPQSEEAEHINGQVRHRMVVQVEGIALFGADTPSEVAERILGDLIRCFTTRTWDRRRLVASPASPVTYDPPYAESIVYQGGGTDSYPEEGSVSVGAAAKFLVTYYTKIGDPYSQ
jgi:hypothetical protein